MVLHMSNNQIKDLPDTLFQDLSHLDDLDVSSNYIENVRKNSFRDLFSLKRLQMAENNISEIVPGKKFHIPLI